MRKLFMILTVIWEVLCYSVPFTSLVLVIITILIQYIDFTGFTTIQTLFIGIGIYCSAWLVAETFHEALIYFKNKNKETDEL